MVSSLTPFIPPKTTERDRRYDEHYNNLRNEFRTTAETRKNSATLTNNFSPTRRDSRINKRSIVFPEYEEQKQCLYVRPKGLLQVDPSRFQITPSELTMLRGKHHIALTQVDVSTATGEVKHLKTPPVNNFQEEFSSSSFAIKIPSALNSVNNSGSVSFRRAESAPLADMDDQLSTSSSSVVSQRGKKGFLIPLPHGTIYNKTT